MYFSYCLGQRSINFCSLMKNKSVSFYSASSNRLNLTQSLLSKKTIITRMRACTRAHTYNWIWYLDSQNKTDKGEKELLLPPSFIPVHVLDKTLLGLWSMLFPPLIWSSLSWQGKYFLLFKPQSIHLKVLFNLSCSSIIPSNITSSYWL